MTKENTSLLYLSNFSGEPFSLGKLPEELEFVNTKSVHIKKKEIKLPQLNQITSIVNYYKNDEYIYTILKYNNKWNQKREICFILGRQYKTEFYNFLYNYIGQNECVYRGKRYEIINEVIKDEEIKPTPRYESKPKKAKDTVSYSSDIEKKRIHFDINIPLRFTDVIQELKKYEDFAPTYYKKNGHLTYRMNVFRVIQPKYGVDNEKVEDFNSLMFFFDLPRIDKDLSTWRDSWNSRNSKERKEKDYENYSNKIKDNIFHLVLGLWWINKTWESDKFEEPNWQELYWIYCWLFTSKILNDGIFLMKGKSLSKEWSGIEKRFLIARNIKDLLVEAVGLCKWNCSNCERRFPKEWSLEEKREWKKKEGIKRSDKGKKRGLSIETIELIAKVVRWMRSENIEKYKKKELCEIFQTNKVTLNRVLQIISDNKINYKNYKDKIKLL